MTLSEFIQKAPLKFSIKKSTAPNPSMPDPNMNHYRFTITNTDSGNRMSSHFSTGSGWTREPSISDVLECLITDASFVDQSFDDWCRDLGYSNDSRKALAIYKRCVKLTENLKKTLGPLYQEAIQATEN